MNSTKSLQTNFNLPPKRPSNYKFLMRSIRISSKANAFRNCRVKGFYLKKILDYSRQEDSFEYLEFKSVSQVFKNKKIHKTLTHVEITTFLDSNVHQCLKTSKNLKTYVLEFRKNNTSEISFAIRKLPANIQIVSFFVERSSLMDKKDIYDIARSIRRLHKLESFQRERMYQWTRNRNNGCYVQKELAIYSKSVKRLKRIKRMFYSTTDNENAGLQRAFRKGFIYRGITGLDLYFYRRENMERLQTFQRDMIDEDLFIDFAKMAPHKQNSYRRIKNEIKQRDKAENDDIDWSVKSLPDEKYEEKDFGNGMRNDPKFLQICLIREDLRPFYRFELFPDLKELSLEYAGFGNPFGPFVIDGFRALTNLEHLRITLHKRSKGMIFLFTALLKLPLLKSFSLLMNEMNDEEFGLFGHFVHIQKKIQEFHFGITTYRPFLKTSYLQQNDSIRRTLQCLKSNFSLKSLHLDFPFVSLETISQGLSELEMINQLHTFEFKACDDIFTSHEKPLKRVEGLCQFINDQKEALKILHINLPLASDDTSITYLAKAVSHLSQLKELHFKFNTDNFQEFGYYQRILQFKPSPELQEKLPLPEKWNPSLAKNLKKLASLENFKLVFDIICTEKTDSIRWFVDVVSILPDFEKLKTLIIVATFKDGSLGEVNTMFRNHSFCLPNIKYIVFWLDDFDTDHLLEELDNISEEINERQSRKNDYLFY